MKSLATDPDRIQRAPRSGVGQYREALLTCGIGFALLYALMNVIVPMLYPGYDTFSQTVSELSAIGAPTRTLWVVLGALYNVLVTAFGLGILIAAGERRALRVAGWLLLISGPLGFLWAPMHTREVLAAGGGTLTDTMHIAWTAVWGLMSMTTMAFAAAALGRAFRWYTVATIVVLLAAGALVSTQSARLEANLPTPWMGFWQRINIGSFLLWIVTFAVVMLREARSRGAAGRAVPLKNRNVEIEGFALPGFEAVREAFAENFTKRNELGGACCIYHDGEKVVDLWGGIRNEQTGEPWEEHTMVIVFSTTKGLAAMTLALAHSRGLIDYDEKVCTYWPGFAQYGKETITVRQLLAHQAGLHAFHENVDRSVVADLDRLAKVMERERPEWPPGERQAYHAITLGFYEGELIRRVDPLHRSLGQFFQDEIATPLELEFYIRLPESIPSSQLAVLDKGNILKTMLALPRPLLWASLNPRSHIFRALMVNPGSWVSLDDKHIYARNLEVPSGGGVGTARAIARAYSAFATGGADLGLRPETIRELTAPAKPPKRGFFDEALRGEVQYSLGFMKPSPGWPFGHEGAFGTPGAGGSLGYADPETGLAYAYVTNRMGTVDGDPRDVALRNAIPAITRREPSNAGNIRQSMTKVIV